MTDNSKLIIVKAIHTLIWIFFNLVLAYLFYAAYTNQVGLWFWLGISLIGLECIILFVNNWTCPLTPIARRYTNSNRDNFDIYLPNWLARHNKVVYSTLFAILVGIYIWKVR